MWEYVEYGLCCPCCFEVEGFVFGESAVVEDAFLRACGGPFHGVGFATVVESCPVEYAGGPFVVAVEFPSARDDVFLVVGACFALVVDALHPSLDGVGVVDVARAASACFFGAYDDPVGVCLVSVVDVVLDYVVVAVDVDLFSQSETAGVAVGVESCVVDVAGVVDHGSCYLLAFVGAFDPPFFVAYAPEEY